jgi:ethanolamine utilization protein EutA
MDFKHIKSVGIDIGTSTTHVVFSELTLKKSATKTQKFEVSERKTLFQSKIYLTPLINSSTIDVEKLQEIFSEIYQEANISISDIDTGAVIITGETARKENADLVVASMAEHAGKFVGATAGPNYESIISAFGSGAVTYSDKNIGKLVVNVDIGGGTSNIAVLLDGKVIDTACTNVGGRLLVFNDNYNFKIKKTEKAIVKCAENLRSEINLELNNELSIKELETLSNELKNALFEILEGKPLSELKKTSKDLLMTDPLVKISNSDSEIYLMFSGGVSEYIYSDYDERFQDNAYYLAQSIKNTLLKQKRFILIEPEQRIRATVVGAGQYSLAVSGSTTFISENLRLPLRNIPVIFVPVSSKNIDIMDKEIKNALSKLDLRDGDNFALAFEDPVKPVYSKLTFFTRQLEKSLPVSTARLDFPLILIFNSDIGNSVGNVARRETTIRSNILSIDEISLKEGDFIDIGEPIIGRNVIPVVVKTLIFSN